MVQLQSVKQQKTKFGEVLVAETHAHPQRFLLGFQISPPKRLAAVVQQAQAMVKLCATKPHFGLSAADIVDPKELPSGDQLAFQEAKCVLFPCTAAWGSKVLLLR